MKSWRICLILLLPFLIYGNPNWNGYLQTRYRENYLNESSFSIRRAKLWIQGGVPEGHWFYKVQGIFRWQNKGAFILQDVFAEYRSTWFRIRFGQMVPQFSLQRSQPDYLIPLIERAQVINVLIPTAETLARDVGAMITVGKNSGRWHSSLGIFNGNGANRGENEDRHFLLASRTIVNLRFSKSNHLQTGISLAYRQTNGMAMKKIFGDGHPFVGTDFRWGVEGLLFLGAWQLQGEYLQAYLEKQKAQGYYILVTRTIGDKHQLTISVDQLKDLNVTSNNRPWWIIGYGYFLKGNKNRIFVDARVQKTSPKWKVQTAIQLQIFFN